VTATSTVEFRFPAIEVRQSPRRALYSFAVDGKLLSAFTTVSRIHRDDAQALGGYQRPEVFSHIAEIREYIESDSPMIPNAIVVAFDKRVRFEPSDVQLLGPAYTRVGTLIITVDESLPPEDRPGWIVDGQQRAAAIRDADVRRFPICVTAFIAGNAHEQREQFILVNTTKPLPKGLIYELLPTTQARLPSLLERRRFPAHLVERLNHDEDSPLLGIINTPTAPQGLIKDNSILRMLENSLSHGALYYARADDDSLSGNVERMLTILKAFWWAVRETFPTAWGLPPRRSRLMHGVGVIGLGFLMDAIADHYRRHEMPTREQFARDLQPMGSVCRWTQGHWRFGGRVVRRWNELQNTPKDIQLLADYLLTQYKLRVWSRSKAMATAAM
jgi:DGQHR domain-containing protein